MLNKMRVKESGLFMGFLFLIIIGFVIFMPEVSALPACDSPGGTCPDGEACIDGYCEPIAEGGGPCNTCESLGNFECNIWNDGCGGTINCGICSPKLFCLLDDGKCHVPANCVPYTCEEIGYSCGVPSDGCGGTLNCGSCPSENFCNSAGQCEFGGAGATCSETGQTILRLSDITNAHGEVFDGAGNYPYEICYNTIFGEVGSGDRTCTGSNEILSLSDTTNAHGEDKDQSNYATEICYGGLTCNARTNDCGVDNPDEVFVASLSDNTNAHLASADSYPVKICCSVDPIPCSFTSASWSISPEIDQHQQVNLNLVTSNCDDGENVTFDIGEVDVGNNYASKDDADTAKISVNQTSGMISSGGLSVSWIAEWHEDENNLLGDDDPEYVFKATMDSDPGIFIDDSGKLKVIYSDTNPCENVIACIDYDTQGLCEIDFCEVNESSVGNMDCNDPQVSCSCGWNSTDSECKGVWSIIPIGGGEDDKIGTCTYDEDTSDNCDDGFLTFSWTAAWSWDIDCDAACQAENQETRNKCEDGSSTRECPAQIPLPFFGFYNFIVALAIIAGIYILWANQGKKKGKKK